MKNSKAVTCLLSLMSILFITFGSQKLRILRQQQVVVSSSSNTSSLLLMTATNTSSNTITTVRVEDSRQDDEQDHKKDEPFLLEEKEEEDSSSYYFSWVGNQWIPPKGVPTYTPKQMLEYFVNKNTLIIGDSTARRFYTTLFAMMTSPDISNIASALVNSAKVIDVNRGRRFGEERCRKEGRSLADNTTTFIETLCRNVFKKDQEESIPSILSNSTTRNNDAEVSEMAARNQSDAPADLLMKASSHDDNTPSSTSSSSSTMRDQKKGKFDYVRMNCYSEVNDYFAENGFHHHLPNSTTLKKDYDLIVIALGIWEVIRPLPCRQINNQTVHDPVQRLRQTLNTLWQQSSSFDTQFVFRTVGFDHNRGHGLSYRMINATREFIKNVTTIRRQHENCARGREQVESLLVPCHHQEGNMIVVDWGSAISKRSFGQDRINGDIKAHYGLEARLLFAQQLMHQLTIASRSSSSSRRSYEKS